MTILYEFWFQLQWGYCSVFCCVHISTHSYLSMSHINILSFVLCIKTVCPEHCILMHKVYITLVEFRHKTWHLIKSKHKACVVSFRKCLVTFGFEQEANSCLLGESRVCDPLLNHDHALESVLSYVTSSILSDSDSAGTLNPHASLPDAKQYLMHVNVTRRAEGMCLWFSLTSLMSAPQHQMTSSSLGSTVKQQLGKVLFLWTWWGKKSGDVLFKRCRLASLAWTLQWFSGEMSCSRTLIKLQNTIKYHYTPLYFYTLY